MQPNHTVCFCGGRSRRWWNRPFKFRLNPDCIIPGSSEERRHKPDSATNSAHRIRRDFLRTATAGAAAFGTLAPPTDSLNAAVDATGDNILKISLIGCGGRGAGAGAQALSTIGPVKLWAMADAFRDRLDVSYGSLHRGIEKRYDRDAADVGNRVNVPEERKFAGLDACRKAIDSGVNGDVAIITGPPASRPIHFKYAVNAGKKVFMGKSAGQRSGRRSDGTRVSDSRLVFPLRG